ncbi:DUF7553 family protein [Halosimplex amylolyticum]|uniref:DUF7553 family protein n=1 Tax=Halosimplex amylolyticum TaxID=3396616 RepID=UPI003F565AA0
MNRHFEDTLYYLKRAVETARKGVTEEVAPAEEKVRELTGREKAPEQGRFEAARERVEREVRHVLDEVRATIGSYRGRTESR